MPLQSSPVNGILRFLLAIISVIPALLLAQSPREQMFAEMDRTIGAAIEDLLRNRLLNDQDVLSYALAHPLGSLVQQPDGTMRRPKYGDHQLEEAEAFLSSRYSRPWTVPKLVSWYNVTKDVNHRRHLLRVLAASRSPQAALLLGEALHSDTLRDAGCYGLYDYFPMIAVMGGDGPPIEATAQWFAKYKERFREAATESASRESHRGNR